jgi:hypothetical protein
LAIAGVFLSIGRMRRLYGGKRRLAQLVPTRARRSGAA